MSESNSQADRPYAPPGVMSTERRRTLGGWLLILCVFLVVLQPAALIAASARWWDATNLTESLRTERALYTTTASLKGIIGVCVGILLALKRRSAPRIARIYFLCMTGVPLVSYAAFTLVLGGPRETIWQPLAFAVPAAWYLYLRFSKRVNGNVPLGGR